MGLARIVSMVTLVSVAGSAAAAGLASLQVNPTSRTEPADQVTLRLIVVNSAGEARRVVDQLKNGANFADLARTISIDATADEGGLVGTVPLAALRSELKSALRGVKVGQIARVVQIPTGFAVLQVVPESEAGNGKVSTVPPALAAVGSVKYVIDVAGSREAFVSLFQFQKPVDWNLDPRIVCRARRQSLVEGQASVEEDLSPRHAAQRFTQPMDVMQLHFALGQMHAYRGEMGQAIEQFQEARQIARSAAPRSQLQFDEALGVAYLHKAELENGLYRHPDDRDLLSASGFGRLVRTGDAEQAVKYFLKYLDKKPDELEVRWLLNLAYMIVRAVPGRGAEDSSDPPVGVRIRRGRGTVCRCRRPGWARFVLDCWRRDRRRLRQRWSPRSSDVELRQLCARCTTSIGDEDGRFEERSIVGRTGRSGRWPERRADRLQQRRLSRHSAPSRRLGDRRSANRCCATTAMAPSPT